MIAVTSRYAGRTPLVLDTPGGRAVAYLPRRIVPPAERFDLLYEYVVRAGDRIDTVTAAVLDDPEQFWRLADANAAMRPADLTATPGTVLRVTLPEGVPGNRDA